MISGAATMTNGQVLITPTSGSLANGETFTIVKLQTQAPTTPVSRQQRAALQ